LFDAHAVISWFSTSIERFPLEICLPSRGGDMGPSGIAKWLVELDGVTGSPMERSLAREIPGPEDGRNDLLSVLFEATGFSELGRGATCVLVIGGREMPMPELPWSISFCNNSGFASFE
jgi:hypothetical protein